MKRLNIELTVGIFMIIGILCLAYLSIRLGKMEILGHEGYDVYALFSNTGGLKDGAAVMIAGVGVGTVKNISLEDFQAKVILNLNKKIKLQEDAIASIKTKGLIGEKFIELTPGGAEELIPPGGRIRETQPAVDFEKLISNFVFGKI